MIVNHTAANGANILNAINGSGSSTGATTAAGNVVPAGSAGGSSGSASGANALHSSTSLGGTDFLTLMLAQLKNQDPTSPIDSNAFLTQLAQLSEVQGINQLNTSFGSLTGSLSSNQALQASSLLGHQALVASGTATLSSGGTVSGAVQVPQTTSNVVVGITDASGALVDTVSLGAQPAGLANFTWNGATSSGGQAPPGQYSIVAQYVGAGGAATAATTLVNGTIESVSMGAGSSGLTVNVAGIGSVPFSSVQQISN